MDLSSMLVALDGSEVSQAVLPYAEAIARAAGTALTLLAVDESQQGPAITPLPVGPSTEALDHYQNARRDDLHNYLNLHASRLRDQGLHVDTLVEDGRPADTIQAVAERLNAGVIALATHGRGGIARLLIGSVADKVMRASDRTVLLVRAPGEEGAAPVAPQPLALRRLLVPLDGSAVAESALPPAVQLGKLLGARLLLVRVEPLLATGAVGYGTISDFSAADEAIAADAAAYLVREQEQTGGTLQAEVLVLRGDAASSLVDVAQHRDVDLVVMSSHGRGGLRRLVLGSVADRIIRAGVPALLVRPDPAAHGG